MKNWLILFKEFNLEILAILIMEKHFVICVMDSMNVMIV